MAMPPARAGIRSMAEPRAAAHPDTAITAYLCGDERRGLVCGLFKGHPTDRGPGHVWVSVETLIEAGTVAWHLAAHPDTDGLLREALVTALEWYDEYGDAVFEGRRTQPFPAAALGAALTATEAAPLDVEAAARAWHDAGHGQHGSPGADASGGRGWVGEHAYEDCPHREHWLKKAERFVAAYTAAR